MPDQHPASTSDARKRLAENLATPDHGHDPAALLARAEKAEAELAALRADCAVYVTLRHQAAVQRDAALAALARVEALADKWGGTPGAYGDHGSCLSAAWREADRELRAALTPSTSKETPDE